MKKPDPYANPESDLEDYSVDGPEDKKDKTKDQDATKEVTEVAVVKPKKKKGFEALNLDEDLLKAIKQKGYKVPTAIQKKVIPLFLEGRDIIASARTGSGKTAAFLVPLISRLEKHSTKYGARSLILLPTRELALQTASNLKALIKFKDLRYSIIVGGHGYEGQFESLGSNPDIVIATPGRLMQLLDETKLSLKSVEYLIFDEADSLFEMGFSQQIRQILTKVSVNRQTFMFSATIPEEVSEFAIAGMRDYAFCRLDSDFVLPSNLLLHFFICRTSEKIPLLIHLFKNQIDSSIENTIIFTATSYWVDYLVELLNIFGIKNVGIYGKMDQLARKEQMGKFFRREVSTLVVTDLVARGIDLPFVDNVINLDFPSQNKLFIHRCGRTARAGKPGIAYNLIGTNELPYLQQIRGCLERPMINTVPNQENVHGNDITFDKAYSYYGKVRDDNLQTITQMINSYLKEDQELQKHKEVSEKSMGKFGRTRGSAAVDKEYKVSLDLETVHPLFSKPKDVSDIATENLLARVTNYKPRRSYMELKYLKQRKGEEKEKFNTVIGSMKSEVTTMRERKERFAKIREYNEKRKKEHPEELEDEIDQEHKALTSDEEKDNNESDDGYQIEIPDALKQDGYLLGKKNLNKKQLLKEKRKLKKLKTEPEDFQSKKLWISHEANPEAVKEFEDADKIGFGDLNTMFLNNDEGKDLQSRKKMQWDKVKRRYVQIKVNARGEQINGGRHFEKAKEGNVAGEKYKSWTRKNMMGFQKLGEEEDLKQSSRAKNLFSDRKKTNYRSEGSYNYRGITEGSKKIKKVVHRKQGKQGASKDGQVVSELKEFGTILKKKKKDKNMNMLQMDKHKRSKIVDAQKKTKLAATATFKKGHIFNKLNAQGMKAGKNNIKIFSKNKFTK